jgi:hypothetical protein
MKLSFASRRSEPLAVRSQDKMADFGFAKHERRHLQHFAVKRLVISP